MAHHIRAGIVYPHPLFRYGLRCATTGTDIVVVAEGHSMADARQILDAEQPDILLLEFKLLGRCGVAVDWLSEAQTRTRIVGLTAPDDTVDVPAGLVRWRISTSVTKPEVVRAIEAIYSGKCWPASGQISPMRRRSKEKPPRAAGDHDGPFGLTHREMQIVGYVSKGFTNHEIALELGISLRAIKYFMSNVFRKMNVRNRVEAVVASRTLKFDAGHRHLNGTPTIAS
jgi:two-component system, NarL family, nitrate/nitrite response regulator NarL